MEKYCTAGRTTQDTIMPYMRFECRIIEATHTHTEYVMIISLPRQQRLSERASMVRYATLPASSRLMTEVQCVYCRVRTDPSTNNSD